MIKFLPFLLVALSGQVQANCEQQAEQAYQEMLNYQVTGETSNQELKLVQKEISFFDKKAEAQKAGWEAFDKCTGEG